IPESAPPVKMQIPISIMVQVKGIEMSQDMLDAFTGAVGLGAANPLWAIPGIIQEMIFRSKILVNGGMNLKFVDWLPGSLKAAFSIDVRGNGVIGKGKNKTVWSVKRTYMADGWLVPAPGAFMPQVARELDKIPGSRTVFNFVRNSDQWDVDDLETRDFETAACAGEGKIVGHTKESYKGPLGDERGHPANNRGMNYVYDYTSKKMFLDIREPSVDGNHRDYATLNGKVTRNVNEDIGFGLFPSLMTRAATPYPLGYEIRPSPDPSELEEGGTITGDYFFKQPYKNGFLMVKYKYVIKPSFDEEAFSAMKASLLPQNPLSTLALASYSSNK
ncbi:MAG: hypothetical protein H7Y17_17610, partial [Chlorobia bacterium]|nr:hypothetical protein [Fimbriimonadaceae bacterium]